MVFVSLVCKFGDSEVTVWDQRIKRTDSANHILNLEREYIEYYLTDIKKSLKD